MQRQNHRSQGQLWRSLGSALLAAALCATTWAQDNAAALAAPQTAAWGQTLAEVQALKDLLEKQNRETQNRLTQLEKTIQSLQAMPGTAQAAAAGATGHAVSVASEAQTSSAPPSESASEPASEPASATSTPAPAPSQEAAPTQPVTSAGDFDLTALPQPLWWTGALLLCMLLLIVLVRWRANRASKAPKPIQIPPQMASISLDLDAPPSALKDKRT